MSSIRRAVIDVGTNSIKLLVGEVEEGQVRPVLEESRQTRLGKGFYPDLILQPGPIAESARAVLEFAAKAKGLGAAPPRVVATSAMREARNRDQLVSAIERECALTVRIISGEQEADYAFRGVTSDPRFAKEPLFLLDVGGGSTEFIAGQGERKDFARSFPLGTVRLLERSHPSDPPTKEQLASCRQWVLQFLEREVGPKLFPVLEHRNRAVQLVGTGGTASILGCMECGLNGFDRDRLEATQLSREHMTWHVQHLWELGAQQRREVVGLPPNRADVILTGSAIYEAIMAYFDFSDLRVSTRGLRFGILMED